MTIVGLFLNMPTKHHWPFHNLDVKSVFLHGDLEKDIYMEQHFGIVAQGSLTWFVNYTNSSVFSSNLPVLSLENSLTLFKSLG